MKEKERRKKERRAVIDSPPRRRSRSNERRRSPMNRRLDRSPRHNSPDGRDRGRSTGYYLLYIKTQISLKTLDKIFI